MELNAAAKDSKNGGEIIAIQADVGTKQGVTEFYEKCETVIDKVSELHSSIQLGSECRLLWAPAHL